MHVKAFKFGLLSVLMFGFSFAMVPLYDAFCEITGLNGKTNSSAYNLGVHTVDDKRLVGVQFSKVSASLKGIEVKPSDKIIQLHPGEIKKTTYVVHNQTNATVVLMAVPSVAPSEASMYLQKLDCFCFEQQLIKPNSSLEMPVVFFVEASLPTHIEKMTLNYTIYKTDQLASRAADRITQ